MRLRARATSWWPVLLVFLGALAFYGLQARRTVGFGDPAEFIVASHTLGIPHPPGYPLYISLGKLFTWIPIGSIAARVHFLSAACAALALAVLFRLLVRHLARRGLDATAHAVGLVVVALLCSAPSPWQEALIAEVYTLKLLCVAVLLLLLVEFLETRATSRLLAAAFVYGASFGVHLSHAFLLPFLLPFVGRELVRRPRLLAGCAGLTLLGTLPYALLYLRGLARPSYLHAQALFFDGAYRTPGTRPLPEFLWFISGGVWRDQYVGSAAEALGRLGQLAIELHAELGTTTLVLALLGVLLGLGRRGPWRRFTGLLLAVLAAEGTFYCGYDVVEGKMILPAIACGVLLAGVGLALTCRALALAGAPRAPQATGLRPGPLELLFVGALGLLALAPALARPAPRFPEHDVATRWVELLIQRLPEGSTLAGLSWGLRRTVLYHELALEERLPFAVRLGRQPVVAKVENGRAFVAIDGSPGEDWKGYELEAFLELEGAPTVYRLLRSSSPSAPRGAVRGDEGS